jgi:predicted DNA-binding ribbon-helix-helix protein
MALMGDTEATPAGVESIGAPAKPVAAPAPQVQHRIVQFHNRRYSLKLGADAWEILEMSAKRRGIRLNLLIGEIAEAREASANLSATLRSYCMEELKLQLGQFQERLREAKMQAGGVSVEVIADSIPTPCFVLNERSLVVKTNAASRKWLGMEEAALRDQPIDRYLQIKVPVPLPRIIAQFGSGRGTAFPARVICLRPGRLIMAKATICPATVRSESDLLFFLLVDTAP